MMRRTDRERDKEFALDVIDHCDMGVVAVSTGSDVPYCLPLSLVRKDDMLYFHCARQGKKIDLLKRNPWVSITFVGQNEPAQDEFTTYYKSAMVTGCAFEIMEPEEKIEALRLLSQRFNPGNMDQFDAAIERSLRVTSVWSIRMESITAKQKARPDKA